MAGRGPAPKADRVEQGRVPVRGEPMVADAVSWRFEPVVAPDGLMPASELAWSTWFDSWFAAFWTPSDIPGLRQLIRLYDQVERGEFQRASELRLQMDTYGITPKGQQDRRWKPPTVVEPKPERVSRGGTYGGLRAV